MGFRIDLDFAVDCLFSHTDNPFVRNHSTVGTRPDMLKIGSVRKWWHLYSLLILRTLILSTGLRDPQRMRHAGIGGGRVEGASGEVFDVGCRPPAGRPNDVGPFGVTADTERATGVICLTTEERSWQAGRNRLFLR